mgnify:FL=1
MNRILIVLFLLGVLFWSSVYVFMYEGKESDRGKEFVTKFKHGRDIPVDTSYIEPFDVNPSEEFQRMEATELVDSMTISTRSGDTYTVKALTFSDWDIKSGVFHCVEIYKGGKKIYEMKRMQGWTNLSERLSSRKKEFTFCRPFNVVDDTVVLLFQGSHLNDQSFQLPIVVIKKGKARLVFNQSYKVAGMSYGTSTETHYFASKTIEKAELHLIVKEAKYDEAGEMIERPIHKQLQIVEEGIGFGLGY